MRTRNQVANQQTFHRPMAKTEQMKIFIMNFFSKCFQIGMKSCGFGYFY